MPIYFITAFGFLYWKLPLSNPFIELVATHFRFEILRVLDYSDLMALSILPFSYKYSKRKRTQTAQTQRVLYWGTGVVAVIAFMATSPIRPKLTASQYPAVLASGFYHCADLDSAHHLCAKNANVQLEVPINPVESDSADIPIHFSIIDSVGMPVSDLRPNYIRVLHPFGLVYSTNYTRGSDDDLLGLLDLSGQKVLAERFRILESLAEHPDREAFRKFKNELDGLGSLIYPDSVLFFQCRTGDSVYVMDEGLLSVAQLTEKSIQVLSRNAFLVPRKGTRTVNNKPIGTQKYDPIMKHELDFSGTRYAVTGLDGKYLVTPFIEAAMYSGGDLWTLVCGTDLLLFDVKQEKVIRQITRTFSGAYLMSYWEIPSRATYYKKEWSLVDRKGSRTFMFPSSDSLDNSSVALQFMLKLWNADEQRNSYAWVCFGFNGMPIGVRQQYVPLVSP